MKIDWWTLLFQSVNVFVLMLLLRHFFWKPISVIIAKRQAAAKQIVVNAAAQAATTEAAAIEAAATRAGFAAEREAILAAAHAEADRTRAALLEQAQAHATALETTAHAAIEALRVETGKQWAARSCELGIDIARRLAGRLQGGDINAAFLDWLVTAIQDLPQAARQEACSLTNPIDAVTATALTPGEQALAAASIDKAFGAHVKLAFRTDPAIIAGLELHASHLSVTNSWQADLAGIRADLADAG